MHNIRHKTGSDNVFADLGIPDAPEYLAKADIARKLVSMIRERGITQSRAAQLLGIDQPKVSALMRGILIGFSIERLIKFAALLGANIQIEIVFPSSPTKHLGAHAFIHRNTDYFVFGTGVNTSKSYPLSTDPHNEDWRLAAPLIVAQNTINQPLYFQPKMRKDNG